MSVRIPTENDDDDNNDDFKNLSNTMRSTLAA